MQDESAMDEPPNMLNWTLSNAPLSVIKATGMSCGAGALYGSAYGVISDIPGIPLAFQTSVNVGLFAFPFFATRAYLFTPLLVSYGIEPAPWEPKTNVHTHRMLSTGLSGLSIGTAFTYLRRGPKGMFKGGMTLALGCCAVQLGVNELSYLRMRSLAKRDTLVEPTLQPVPGRAQTASLSSQQNANAPSGLSSLSTTTGPIPNLPLNETPYEISPERFPERSDRLIGQSWSWAKSKMSWLNPIKPIDQQEYAKTLEEQLERTRNEKAKLKAEMDALEKKLAS